MSTEAAAQFIQKIYEDEGLRNKLTAQTGDIAHTDLSQDASTGSAFVNIGAEHGFNFDVSDLQDAYRAFAEQQMSAGYGELNEADLDSVAGGLPKSSICESTLCKSTC